MILYFLSFFTILQANLFLTRHYKTNFNKCNIYTGHLNIPIIKPKFDYSQIKRNINNQNIDLVLCSNTLRCKQTLECLNLKIPIIYSDKLIECGYGNLTGLVKNPKLFKRNLVNKPCNNKYFKGESILDGGIRAYLEVYFQILLFRIRNNKLTQNISVLIISHKNTLTGLYFCLNYNFIANFNNDQFDLNIIPFFDNGCFIEL